MWNFNLLAATRAFEAAMPFMLYRLAVCLAVAFASLIAALVGAGTLIAFASFSSNPGKMGNFGAALGMGAFFFLIYRFRATLFFNATAGHLALMAEAAKGAKLPNGKLQIDLAKQNAARRFPSALGFLEISAAAKSVLKMLPACYCPFLKGIANKNLADAMGFLAGWVLQTSAPALLLACFAETSINPWMTLENGLVIQARHFGMLMKNRMFLLGFEYLGLAIAFLAMLYPVDSAASLLPVDVGVWRYLFAFIFAWSLKAAFLEPIATTALAEIYSNLANTESEPSESELRTLAEISESFKTVVEKAS